MLDRRIKLRHLTCFLAVARNGTIGAAAMAAGMSQPAASKTVRELEAILGVKLFERSRSGSRLTAAGAGFRRHAEAGLAALGEGARSLARGPARQREIIRLGALPTVAARLVPRAVRRFLFSGADALVRVISGTNTALLGDLKIGALDLVVGRMAEGDGMAGLSFEHLYSEAVALVVRGGHPLAGVRAIDAAALSAYPLVMPTEGSIIRSTVDRFMTAIAFEPPAQTVETVSPSFGRAFVASTDAIWIISRGVVEADLAEGGLVALTLDMRDTSGPVGLTLRAEAAPSPATLMLVEALRSAAAQLRREAGMGGV